MNFMSAASSFLFMPILLLVAARLSFATTIAVLKTQSEIVAGADSMGVYIAGNQGVSNRFCKIHQIHDFFIASGGFFDTRAGQRLNIKDVVTRVSQKSDSFTVATNRSSRAIARALSQAMSDAREDDALYNVLGRGSVVTFFLGFEDRKPAIYARRFSVKMSREHPKVPSVEVTHDDCGPECVPADGNPYLIYTPSQAMDDFRSKNPAVLRDDPDGFDRRMIFFDNSKNQHSSGPPVDI